MEYGKLAETYHYDAISSVAPFYYKFTFDEIKSHYYMIVDEVNLPMVIYNIPSYSGVALTADNIGEFLCDERFIGVKHTSNDYFALEQFKAKFPDKFVRIRQLYQEGKIMILWKRVFCRYFNK